MTARRVLLTACISAIPLIASACDLLLTDPAPPSEVGIALQVQGDPRGGNAAAFSRVRRVALRFARPDSSFRDTIVSARPVDGAIRVGISLETGERVEALGIGAELSAGPDGATGGAGAGLFQGGTVVPIVPGAPTTAEIPLVPIPGALVADRAQLTLAGPGASTQLASAVLFATGDTIDGLQGLWLSDDPTIVAVLPNGVATGVRIGTTRLVVRFDQLADTVDVTVGAAPTTDALATWTAVGGGSWSDAGNWAGGVLPGVGDSVEITVDGTYTITLDASPNLASLVVGGATGAQTLVANGRTITVAGDVDVVGTGTLSLATSALSAAGVSTEATGSLVLEGATVNGPVDNGGTVLTNGVSRITTLTARPGSSLRLEARGPTSAQLTVDNGFTNGGAIDLAGTGSGDAILIVTSGALVNAGAGTITATNPNDHSIVADLDNRGTISTSATTLTLRNLTAAPIINSGTITATAGDVSVLSGTGGFTHTGTLDTSAGGDVLVNPGGGPFTTSGIIATGGGMLTVSGGTMGYTGGALAFGDAVTLNAVTANFTAPMTLGTTGPLTLALTGATLTTPGLTTATATTLTLTGSTLNGPLDDQGDLVARGASAITGALTTAAGASITVQGAAALPAALTVANGFTNSGTIELTNTTATGNAALTVTTGAVSNAAAGTIRAAAGAGGGTRAINANVGTVGTIELTHPLTIGGQLIDPVGAPATYTGNGNALTVSGLNVDGAVFDDMPLISNGGALTLFDNVTFQNMDPAGTQLSVSHPGVAATVIANGLSFATVPTTGVYVSVTETNPTLPSLIIQILGSSPLSGLAQSVTSGGATLLW